MKSFSCLIDNILGNFSETFALNMTLKKAWESIVGPTLDDITDPMDAKYIGRNSIKIVIRVLNSALIYIENYKSFLENSLKQYLNISSVTIVFKQSLNLLKQKRQIPCISETPQKQSDIQTSIKKLGKALKDAA